MRQNGEGCEKYLDTKIKITAGVATLGWWLRLLGVVPGQKNLEIQRRDFLLEQMIRRLLFEYSEK